MSAGCFVTSPGGQVCELGLNHSLVGKPYHRAATGELRPVPGSDHPWHIRLAFAMATKQLPQADLARTLGWHRQRVFWMLQGSRALDVELCAKLADILGCSREWLAGWSELYKDYKP